VYNWKNPGSAAGFDLVDWQQVQNQLLPGYQSDRHPGSFRLYLFYPNSKAPGEGTGDLPALYLAPASGLYTAYLSTAHPVPLRRGWQFRSGLIWVPAYFAIYRPVPVVLQKRIYARWVGGIGATGTRSYHHPIPTTGAGKALP